MKSKSQAGKEWYQRHKKEIISRNHKNKLVIKDWYNKQKTSCVNCGENYKECLVFHHLDASMKLFSVGYAAQRGYKISRLKEEIKKCVCVCVNCHMKIHKGVVKLSVVCSLES